MAITKKKNHPVEAASNLWFLNAYLFYITITSVTNGKAVLVNKSICIFPDLRKLQISMSIMKVWKKLFSLNQTQTWILYNKPWFPN